MRALKFLALALVITLSHAAPALSQTQAAAAAAAAAAQYQTLNENQPPTLKENMKALGAFFKQIIKTASDPSFNQKNADIAVEMASVFATVQTLVPDSIRLLPAAQRAEALSEFQAAIQKEIDFLAALAQAFRSNENAKAALIIQDMSATKKAGHEKYDPQP
jgi:hypothetical protein